MAGDPSEIVQAGYDRRRAPPSWLVAGPRAGIGRWSSDSARWPALNRDRKS